MRYSPAPRSRGLQLLVTLACAFVLSGDTLGRQLQPETLVERRADPYTPSGSADEEIAPTYGREWGVVPVTELPRPSDAELGEVRQRNRTSNSPVVGLVRKIANPVRITIPTTATVAPRPWAGGALASPTGATVVWSGAFRSPLASRLSLGLNYLAQPAGTKWRVYGTSGRTHPFAASDGVDTPVVAGDAIWIEVEFPTGTSPVSFEITSVSYRRDDLDALADNLVIDFPYINAVCASSGSTPAHTALQNLQRAVGYIEATQDGSIKGCSGTLINNTRDPGVPYFITAEHCVPGMAPGTNANIHIYWDYFNTSCSDPTTIWAGNRRGQLPQSVGGVLLVSGSAATDSDVALFRLNSLPNNGIGRHFVGWSTFPFSSDFFRVSHPANLPQMFTRHEWRRQDWREDCEWWELLLGTCRYSCVDTDTGATIGYDRYYYATVKQGAYTGGSSGSAAVNISTDGGNYFVGPLSGSCSDWTLLGGADPRDSTGAMNYFYDRVAAWLDPPNECQDIILEVYPNGALGTVQKLTQPNCGAVYRAGTRVGIRATPFPGYEFDHWDAGVIENPNAAITYATIRPDITPVYRAYFRPATPPANDRCGFATLVSSSPFTDSVVTTGATTDTAHDPIPSCQSSRSKNVWYRFSAAAATPITIDTSGSSYFTVISVYRGSDCFALTEVACSAQPLATTTNTALQFTPQAGETYKVQIAGLNPPAITNLAVRVDGPIANLPPIANDGEFDARFGPITQPFPASDPEEGRLTFDIVSSPTQGTLTVDQDFGEFTYTPNAGAATEDSFQYRANDGSQHSLRTAIVRLTLRPPLTFTVTSTSDAPDDQPGDEACLAAGFGCTLRAAVMELNALNGRAGAITLPTGTFTLSGSANEDFSATGDLDIRVPVVITGAGAGLTIVQTNAADRVLDIPVNTPVTIKALTIRNGRVTGRGGGIRSAGVLTVEDVLIINNTSSDEGGGIATTGGLNLTRSSLIANTADGGTDSGSGAGALRVAGTAVVVNSTIAQNFSDGPGGAIRNYGELFMAYSTVVDNTTRAGATAIDTWSIADPALLLKSNIIGGTCLVTEGVVASSGYNIVLAASCADTALDRTVTALNLGSFSVLPGGTIGALPLTSSAALDSTPISACGDWVERDVLGDQRSGPRPRDGNGDGTTACDSGALEALPLPNAVGDMYAAASNTVLSVASPGVLANDVANGGGALSASLVTNAAHGQVSLVATGAFMYTPASGFTGTDTFTYRVANGNGSSNIATVTIGVTPISAATMSSPSPSSVLSGSSATFVWAPGSMNLQFWLYVGTLGPGSANIWNQDQTLGTLRLISALPTNGSTIFVRLWTRVASGWTYVDYTYTAASIGCAGAAMINPAGGATLAGGTVAFSWNAGSSSNSQYWLSIGTTPGGTQIYNASQGVSLTQTVSGLPRDGRPMHVRLWSLCGSWTFRDSVYTAHTLRGTLMSPPDLSVLAATNAAFSWSRGLNATRYWVYIGSSVGGSEVWNQDMGTTSTLTVPTLPGDGRRIYLRLWSLVGGTWYYLDYRFTAHGTARGLLVGPAEHTVLAGSSATFTWSGGTASTQYWIYVGDSPGAANLMNQNRGMNLTASVSGLPTDRRPVYLRLWSLVNSAWVYSDYVFRAFDGGGTRARLVDPAPGTVLVGSTTTFRWSAASGASQYWLYVGSTRGAADYANRDLGATLTATVSGLPITGAPLYVRLWSLVGGQWVWNDYEYFAAP